MWTRKHGLKGQPLKNLEILVKFCVQMYFKLYFDICVKNKLENGPLHVLTELKILKTLPKKVSNIVTPYVKTGAWFSHSECCLLTLLSSDKVADRTFAVSKILDIRGTNEYGDTSVRPRRTPKLNLDATTLQSLISWNVEDCYEPIFTCNLSQDEIRACIETPYKAPQFHIHTQSTERCVKLVTEAAAAVVGQDRRDGYIRSKLVHREAMPSFNSKQDVLKTF